MMLFRVGEEELSQFDGGKIPEAKPPLNVR
jgi:hypothetical protein